MMHDVRLLGAERLPPLCMCIAVHDDMPMRSKYWHTSSASMALFICMRGATHPSVIVSIPPVTGNAVQALYYARTHQLLRLQPRRDLRTGDAGGAPGRLGSSFGILLRPRRFSRGERT